MVHHSKQRSVSGQRAAIISARNGLRVSLTMYAPRWLALSAFIASPHNLKLNDVQFVNEKSKRRLERFPFIPVHSRRT
jgi:hypothetical protein